MPIKVNFTGVQLNSGFEPWPVNTPIPFTIFKITEAQSKAGNDKLVFEFQQVGTKRKTWDDYSLLPQALFKLKRLLVSLGYDGESLEGNFDFEPNDILGREVLITFGPEHDVPGSANKKQDLIKTVASE